MTKREKLLIDLELVDERIDKMEHLFIISNIAEANPRFWPELDGLVEKKVEIEIMLDTDTHYTD
tara:strand:- start:2479 stop:2670 length:192 start_codon:yes stop_codon:yes gene_type:complete